MYTEGMYSGQLIDDPALVAQYAKAYGRLRAAALPPEVSLKLIEQAAEDYRNGDGGDCVEVADNIPGLVPVRDSKVPGGPALLLTAGAWAPFVGGLRKSGLPR